jgi:tetratricopeptide (TPR) repeat protein
VNDSSGFWSTDPATFRDVALDRKGLENALAKGVPPLERIRYLALLDRESEALTEGFRLLDDSPDRGELLLILSQVFQRQYRWHDAAQLQEQALRLASTRVEEAYVRHHIGRRLFDEARYRDAAAEFQWASDLYRVSGEHELAEQSRRAMQRSQQVHARDPHGLRSLPPSPFPPTADDSLPD